MFGAWVTSQSKLPQYIKDVTLKLKTKQTVVTTGSRHEVNHYNHAIGYTLLFPVLQIRIWRLREVS